MRRIKPPPAPVRTRPHRGTGGREGSGRRSRQEDHDGFGFSVEATVIYTDELMSQKTMSDISNIAFAHRCLTSGVRKADDGRLRMNLGYQLGTSLSYKQLQAALKNITKCMFILERYLLERVMLFTKPKYDFSMFEHIDITKFNLQLMGERKEFIFGSWENYSAEVIKEHGNSIDSPTSGDLLTKIKACEEFEKANEVLLSEVGVFVLEELVLAHQLREISKKTYAIN